MHTCCHRCLLGTLHGLSFISWTLTQTPTTNQPKVRFFSNKDMVFVRSWTSRPEMEAYDTDARTHTHSRWQTLTQHMFWVSVYFWMWLGWSDLLLSTRPVCSQTRPGQHNRLRDRLTHWCMTDSHIHTQTQFIEFQIQLLEWNWKAFTFPGNSKYEKQHLLKVTICFRSLVSKRKWGVQSAAGCWK